MRVLVRVGAAAALSSLLAGCTVTSQVPLAKNVWQIQADSSGHAASLTSEATVKRAAELTVAQGYDRFLIRNPQTLLTEGANHVSVDVVMFHAGDPQAAQAVDAAAYLKSVKG